jgi:uncharacterized protein (DUF2249 family)
MDTPLIFQNNNTPEGASNTPLIFGGTSQKSTPAIFNEPQTQQQPTVQEKNPLQKVMDFIGNLLRPQPTTPTLQIPENLPVQNEANLGENLKKKNISIDIGPAPLPLEQIPGYQEALESSKKQVSEVTRYAAAGVAYNQVLNKLLNTGSKPSENDIELLKSQNLIDEKGNIKIDHLVALTAQNGVDLAPLLLGAPLSSVEKSVGEKVFGNLGIKIAQKIYPFAPIGGRAVSWSILGLFHTPNLDQIVKDPKVREEAVLNTLGGMAIGTILGIPTSFFAGKYAVDTTKVSTIYKDLARKVHPNNVGNVGFIQMEDNAKAFNNLNKIMLDVKNGERPLEELTRLSNLSDKELASYLGENVKTIKPKVGGLLEEKTGAKTTKPSVKKEEGLTLYRGAKGEVTQETKTFNKVLEVKGYKPQLLQQLADKGNSLAQEVLDSATGKKIDFVKADTVIKNALSDKYDAVKYDNSTDNRSAIGVEYQDLKTNEFFAVNKDTASTYAKQNREIKYEEPTAVKVPKEQLPVGTGKTKTSKLASRMQETLKNVSEEDRRALPTYNQMNRENQLENAAQYVTDNPEDAMAVLRGEKDPPQGLLYNSVFLAMQEAAKVGDNITLIQDLASLRSTRYGQEINILSKADPENPVNLLQNLQRTKIEVLEKRTGKSVEKLVKETAKKIKVNIKVPSKDEWEAFIDSIKC